MRFELERGPKWLSLDAATGLLSGTPNQTGSAEVVVSARHERDERRLDEQSLKWGVEKVLSTGPAILGRARQSFKVEVRP